VIVPSIDIQGGSTVQLVGGRDKALDAGDPRQVAEALAVAGELAVIDLDAAMGKGDNRALIEDVVRRHACRVGGGVRSVEAARRWLDAGASKVILGTAARPEILRELPRERVIAAVDAVDGEVVVEGWTTKTGAGLLDTVRALAPYVGGFLVTFVEREGRLGGTALDQVPAIVAAAGDARVTIAGGITTAEEIAALDRLGADAQVGMALYTGRLSLGDAVAAPLVSDRPDGLWPTVVCDVHGVALGLAYSDAESLRAAVARRRGVYHSRKRGLWEKGTSSGAVQRLVKVDLDCDRDTLRFTVDQAGDGFCHEHTWTCWGPAGGVPALDRTLQARVRGAPPGSYTRRLLDDPALLRAKLMEESGELMAAADPDHVAAEAADVLYFTLVAAARGGADLAGVSAELDRRALKTTRRTGDAKPPPPLPTGET
jgi:phosphoribosyl-ATP pyrophosphohydrolase/phosphoribosyl-AMP cyclohydrolase